MATALSALAASACSESDGPGERESNTRPTYEIAGLHPVYDDVAALRSAAALVVHGRVVATTTIQPRLLAADPDGTPMQSLPMTEHSLVVERVAKGPYGLLRSRIAVRVMGGEGPDADYVTEGPAAKLAIGSAYLLFLGRSREGYYYPLAGDAAAATETASGYRLPSEIVREGDGAVAQRTVRSWFRTTERFRLRARHVRSARRIGRRARAFPVRVSGPPRGTRVLARLALPRSAAGPGKAVVLGRARKRIESRTTTRLRIPLSRRARARLARSGAREAVLVVRVSPPHGPPSRVERAVELRR